MESMMITLIEAKRLYERAFKQPMPDGMSYSEAANLAVEEYGWALSVDFISYWRAGLETMIEIRRT